MTLGFVALLVAAFASLGCSVHPLGTNDVALAYRIHVEAGAKEPDLEAVAEDVRTRLAAAQVTADVNPTEGGLSVTVDRDAADAVEELLAWRGGLAVYDVAPTRTLEGPTDEIAERARTEKVASDEKALVLRVSEERARLVVAKRPPRVDLSDAIASVTSPDGTSVVVHLSPEGQKRVEAAMRAAPGTPVAIARATTALKVGPLEGDPIVLPLGDDLYAYARARAVRQLLASPALPALERTAVTALAPDWVLAATAVGTPFLLSLAWLFFVRRFDRAHPEPWPLVAATFALGGLSVVPAALLEVGWARLSPWTDPSLVTMGGRVAALPLSLLVFAVVVGLSEEGSKLLGAWSLAFHTREFDEPVDGVIYGAASALGFAAVENVKYFAAGRFGAVLVVVRTFLSIPAHLFFGSIWGYALGRKLTNRRTSLLAFLGLAALAHGGFDAFLSTEGMGWAALALNLGLASLFVWMLRRLLRHGVVTASTLRVDPEKRFLVPIGSPAAFFGSVAAFHVLAAMIFVGSTIAQDGRRRLDVPLLVAMLVLVVLLAMAAYALAQTMPLDVVFDHHGVTFAGTTRSWRTISGVERSRAGLRVRSSAGDLWIGPATKETLDAVARTISARMLVAKAA
jgi:RsiW-degrading membrane proteinase PrsW (M82 family)